MDKRVEKARFTIGAFAIIPAGELGIVLCHRTDMDFWNLPGGVVESGEAPWDAVVRETKEETGYDVRVVSEPRIYFKKPQNELVFVYTCELIGGGKQTSDESDQFDFFFADQLPKNTLKSHKARIRDWFEEEKREFYSGQSTDS